MSLFILRDNEPRFGHYGYDMSPEDLLLPLTLSSMLTQGQRHRRGCPRGQVVAKRDENTGFEVNVDVQQFKPEEITVKVVDNSIVVEAKHEERRDEHGYVSRQFTRRYVLPEDCDLDKVASNLSSDGVLTLFAPKKQAITSGERVIPVIHTGGPHRQQSVQENKMQVEETAGDAK